MSHDVTCISGSVFHAQANTFTYYIYAKNASEDKLDNSTKSDKYIFILPCVSTNMNPIYIVNFMDHKILVKDKNGNAVSKIGSNCTSKFVAANHNWFEILREKKINEV